MTACSILVSATLAACSATGVPTEPASSAPPSATVTASATADCSPGTRDVSFRGQSVRVHIPKGAQGPIPAVVVLHGAGDSGPGVQSQTEFDAEADRQGFMTVYPSAASGEWDLGQQGVAFVEALGRDLARQCADPSRLYLTGFSRGSAMTFTVACSAGRPVYAAYGGVAFADWRARCRRAAPAPIVYLHGTADQTVSFQKGYRFSNGVQTPPTPLAMRKWARHNRCAKGPIRTTIGDDVVRRAWRACKAAAAVDFYAIKGGDHQWPFKSVPNGPLLKSGQSWASVGATEVMWRFFRKHRLPGV